MSEPNQPVVSLRDLSPEAALAKLELAVGRRIDGFLHGDHLGFGIGHGTEAGDVRPYVPGQDDVRRIDWNVTARTHEVHVRNQEADRELDLWALVDATPSMDFGTAVMEKRDVAAAAAVALARVALRSGDRFGARVLTSERVLSWPDRGGRLHQLQLLRALTRAPRVGPGAPLVGLAQGIEALDRPRRRGLRVVVSDLMDPDRDVWRLALRRLAFRHRVLVVEVVDPRELDLPDVGVVTFLDPESGRTHDVDTSSRRVRERFAAAAREERAEHADAVRSAGAGHLVVSTDGDWLRRLTRFVLTERQLGRPTTPFPRTAVPA